MRKSLDMPRALATAEDGILVVDKPAGVTSHDVASAIRRLAATRKVGHAGTLDPMATGVLVMGIGKATKLLTFITGSDKAYRARILLGASTDTDDAEGEILSAPGLELSPDLTAKVDRELAKLSGEQMQVPTTVSAIKIDGKRAHALHRAGQDVKLAARPVTISRLERTTKIKAETLPDGTPACSFECEVECSSGTYVRAIARDLGNALGTGGHLTALRRTRVGKWTLNDAVRLDDLANHVRAQNENAPQPISVIPLTDAVLSQFESIDMDAAEAEAMRHGNATKVRPRTPEGQIVACLWKGRVRALLSRSGAAYKPVLVFSTEPL